MKNNTISLIFLILILPLLSNSQTILGTKVKATKHATVRVSELPQVAEAGSGIKVPNLKWEIPNWKINKDKVIFLEENTPEKVNPAFRGNSPAPDTTFVGLGDTQNSIPPDVNGAAGPEYIMETLNTQVRITDRQGNNLFTTALGSFWAGLPGSGSTFDPKIIYDPYNNCWIMITPRGSTVTDSRIYLGVSTTSNPLDEWNYYAIDTDTENLLWFDYPNLGFNKNWISIGGIMRNSAFDPIDYVVFTVDKLACINGEESPVVSKFTTTLGSVIVPAFTYDAELEELYLIATADGNLEGYGYVNLYKVSGEVNDPVFEMLGSVGIPEPWENWSYNEGGDFLPQLGSIEKLNSIDARMHTLIVRINKLWAVHHIYLPADDPQRCAIQWWNLDTVGTILERGRIDDPDGGFSYAFGSIAVNSNEDVFIGHGIFSETQYAGAGYSYKAYFDEPNSMRNYYQYAEGLAPYYKTFGGGRNRWGDYSAVCVDPLNDIDFWAMHEYAETPTTADSWGTMIAFMKPSFPPIAKFTSDEILIPVGESVNFIDQTLGVPSNWEWTFEGGSPGTSEDQNPSNVMYEMEGSYDVTLISSNELGTDTIIKENYITASSTILPEVAFEASKTVTCLGEAISFTDFSAYSPIQWEWQFDPPSVNFVNGTDQNSQNPKVEFNEALTYAVTLTVWNLNGSSVLTKFDYITSGGYVPYLLETFENETFQAEEWSIQNPDNSVTWQLFEIGGNTPGNMAMGLNFSEYLAIGARDRLISPPINLEGLSSATLEFQYAYAKRMPEISDSLIIKISSNCEQTWSRIFAGGEDGTGNFATHQPVPDGSFWPETEEDWCGSGWGASCVSIDLTPWLGLPDVKIAFETWSGYGNPVFIDNINISQFTNIDRVKTSEDNFTIFPNPASNEFSISISKKDVFNTLKIINSLGETVYFQKLNSEKIQIENKLAPGLYIVVLSGNGKTTSKKMLIY
ncbi:MAG TPA: PKD domain-containing protein [Bacteroidales bacterium]